MSKTLEGTRRSYSKEDALLEHIASTYFSKKARPKSRSKSKAPSLKDLVIVIISAVVIFSALGFILALSSIAGNNYNEYLKKKVSGLAIISLVEKGSINKDVVARSEFLGYAGTERSKSKKFDEIALKNPKKYNWADFSLPLRFPIDLTSRTLNISIKGLMGGERAFLVLRDSGNRSFRIKEFSLSSNWADESIPVNSARKYIDIKNISAVRIEYGRIGESAADRNSSIGSAIFVKNINFAKEK